ncbi:helix-turn-helix transcriptional regulator [Actinoallomurus iriomotensis]|uniref:LuxR family transcriptional regulator n=1 Tax=Actinoallomurus iriomotensis TaxID=478107 RepID=A0A9W6S4U9_9ACTN|nr:hypothetical protein [Actinoallomurus iriomotensis]GLY88290.1 hypothetical protein Airi02_062190 [Actinoallomurus iriomotensis]
MNPTGFGSTRPDGSAPSALHHPMFAVDISAFGTRQDRVQLHLRTAMYEVVRHACDSGGLSWDAVYREDRGDGMFAIAPASTSVDTILDSVVPHIRAGLRQHNTLANPAAQIRMRMAVHAGYVYFDDHGVSGHALVQLFRFLDSATLKAALRASDGELALLVSGYLYDEVIRHGSGLTDPAAYRRITVTNKETSAEAWVWSPSPHPSPAGEPVRSAAPLDLTEDEVLVALLLASGWSRTRIAQQLEMERTCVDRHIGRVMAKLSLATATWPK